MATKEQMRFTVIDAATTVSFVAPTTASVAFMAACAEDPLVLDDLIEHATRFDPTLPVLVRHGLAIFDEHNVPGDHAAIDAHIQTQRSEDLPLFRVVDAATRRISLATVGAGLIVFDLPQRRITQIANTAEPLLRSGAVYEHAGPYPRQRTVTYTLPGTWSLIS
jgi:hypothetical protein